MIWIAFYGVYRADGSGRAAHDPAMMVALSLYGYAVGERSSRVIERRCVEDVAFRVIAANRAPDHTTIARFRQRHAERLAELFVQVLALCAKAGMVRVGTVAVDGTKLAANAGISANRSYEKIRGEVERMLAEAEAVDAAEDERFGDARGTSCRPSWPTRSRAANGSSAPSASWRPSRRRAWPSIEAMLARRAEYAERTGRPAMGRPPGDGPGVEVPADAKRNITDPDSRIMRERGGLVQAYNAQALVGEGRVILAADVTMSPNDSNQLVPMLAGGAREPAGRRARPEDQVRARRRRLLEPRRHRQGPPEQNDGRDPDGRPAPQRQRKKAPHQGPEADRINKILATAAGKRLYRRRAELVEPVFAHTKHTRRIARFSRRGHTAVRAEWR